MDSGKLVLTSPIPPSVNHYLAYRAVVKNGRPMATSYCTKEALAYKRWLYDYVVDQVAAQNRDLEPNKYRHFNVKVVAYFPRIDMDANNYWKCMLDAITETKLIWLDDNVVCEHTERIYYDSFNPHFEITISPTEYIGVFDNEDLHSSFVSKCKTCTRDYTKCGLLKDCEIGRISEFVKGNECFKYKERKGK